MIFESSYKISSRYIMKIGPAQFRGTFIILLFLIHCATNQQNLKNKNLKAKKKRVDIGQFPANAYRRQGTRQQEDGDVYEFHRFQHYGYKTPAPSTFSLESMLAFLAPLATVPIIAGAALSSLATILPSLTTEGMITGRSRREAVLQTLEPPRSFGGMYNTTTTSSWINSSDASDLQRDIRDLDVIQKFLRQSKQNEDYNDEVMATYLQCSGMLSHNNHCLERLVCQFSDKSTSMPALEKDVASLIIYTILNNKRIKDDFKHRLRQAAFFGRDTSGRCSLFSCSRNDFGTHL